MLDVRVEPSRISLPGWAEGELALALVLRTIMLQAARLFRVVTVPLAQVGLHAIARRFQRGRRSHGRGCSARSSTIG